MKFVSRNNFQVGLTFLLLNFASLISSTHNTFLPDETGGYSILFALEEVKDSAELSDNETTAFIDNVKRTFEEFSIKLWEASRHTFYIKSVDILVPNSWNVESPTFAKYQSFSNADIRLPKSSRGRPFVENANICGEPGQFIELPSFIFNNSTNSSDFGPTWKLLLNLWATYRWGVHEEHGYIGDLKFPYAFRDLSKGEWEVTGCSDREIKGSFKYLNDTSQTCTPQDTTTNPSSTCRFIPDPIQNATTSLMHFHWLESVNSFCDETNHNKLAPNRQNALCNHKSVWEVIRESKDFKEVTKPIPDSGALPNLTFQLLQHSPTPALYILMDQGRIQGPLNSAYEIPRALIQFLSSPRRNSTLATIRKFPGSSSSSAIETAVEWAPVGLTLDSFVESVGNLYLNGSTDRDFSRAISEAVEEIKIKDHPYGAVIIVIKYGADLDNLGNHLPEPTLINALNAQGIILNSIELNMTSHPDHAHLSQLARETGGIYTVIGNHREAENSLENVFSYLHKILDEEYTDLRKQYRTLLLSSVRSGEQLVIPLHQNGDGEGGKLQIFFSTMDGTLRRNGFIVEFINRAVGRKRAFVDVDGLFKKRQDWLENGSKWTYLLEFSQSDFEAYSEVAFRTNCTSCRGQVLIRTDVKDEAGKNVSISVFTNKEGPEVDLTSEGPIVIFAKVLMNRAPVQNALVKALIQDTETSTKSEIILMDDGEQAPDEIGQDGIYSAYFIPGVDGKFKISVVVQGFPQSKHKSGLSSSRGNGNGKFSSRLLPIDQGEMGCSGGAICDLEDIPEQFMQTVELLSEIRVTGAAQFIPEPSKITSFLAAPNINDPNTLQLIWISPSVPGRFSSVSSYDVRKSQNYESLLTNFEDQEEVPLPPSFRPAAPGSLETFLIRSPSVTTFYAVRSVYRGKFSKTSDIQGVEIQPADPTTTTTPTTTSSTTPSTSTSSGSTNPPTDPTPTTPSSSPTTPSSTSTSSPPPSTSSSDLTDPPPPPTTDVTPTPSSPSPSSSSTDTPPVTSPTTTPKDDSKPWAKKPAGIAIITLSALILLLLLLILIFILWKRWKRSNVTGKINPPSQSVKVKAEIPETIAY